MRICRPAFLLLLCGLACSTASAQQHTERGAVLGGLSGALIGAAIGDQNGETAEGALIGGAVGLLSGTAIGSSVDAQQAQAHARYRQHVMTQMSRAVSTSDVVSMTQNGIGDAVIMNQMQQFGVQRRLEVADVIMLHKQGVSEQVITAMQKAPVAGGVTVSQQPSYAAPIVVQRHHYVAPRYYVYPPRGYRHHTPHLYHYGHPHQSRVHFGFSVRH